MELDTQQIFGEIQPYRVMDDLQLRMREENGQFIAQHPNLPDTDLYLTRTAITSNRAGCPFLSGDIFDFLAFHLEGSYAQAVEYVVKQYPNLVKNLPGVSLSEHRQVLVDSLVQRRRKFHAVLDLQKNLIEQPSALLSSLFLFRQRGLDVQHLRRMLYVAYGEELAGLSAYYPHKLRLQDKAVYVVYPYFTGYHTFAFLKIQDATTGEESGIIRIHPAAYSYFGLHTCLPGSSDCRVYSDLTSALAGQSSAGAMGNYLTGNLHVHFNAESPSPDFKLPVGTLVISGQEPFNQVVRTRTAFESFQLTDQATAATDSNRLATTPWDVYVYQQFIKLADQGNANPRLVAFMHSLKTDVPMFEQLNERLISGPHASLISQLTKFLSQNESCVLGDMQISETTLGFKAHRIKTGAETWFTNFIIKLDHNLWFDSTEELFHTGRVLINQTSYPICLPHTALAKAQEIESRAQAAVLRHSKDSGAVMPMITDTTLRARLLSYLSYRAASLPRISGIDSLGWNKTYTQFHAPAWQADTLGIHVSSKIPHPNLDYLNQHYSFSSYVFTKHTQHVSPDVKYFFSILISMLVRSFLRLTCPAVRVVRNNNSVHLLHALFMPLGQKMISEINPNIRASSRGLLESKFNGYPVFAYCNNPKVVETVNLPMFLLGDAGTVFNQKLDPDVYAQVCTFAYEIISKVVLGLIRDGRKSHDLVTADIPNISDLVFEGKRAVERYHPSCDFEIFTEDLPRFRSVLSEIAFEDLATHFRFSLEDQSIRMFFSRLKGHSREKIMEELKTKNASVALFKERYITAPSEFMCDLLSRFYGRPVRIFNSTIEEDPTETAPVSGWGS